MHLSLGLTHRKSADGDAGRIERGNKPGGSRPQVRINPALNDAEQGLIGPRFRFDRTFRPAMSPIHGNPAVHVIVGIGTFIEGHDDIGAKVPLNGDGFLRREAMRRTINVTLEGDAVIVDLAGLREREDLKAAGIGEHGRRPLHELMQTAHITDEFIAGPQIEVVGIAQDERGLNVFEMLGREGFDRGLGTDRRKYRGRNITMRGMQNTCTRFAVLGN